MRRVSSVLARGIVLAAVLFTSGRLSDPAPSRLFRGLALVRDQDFTPIFGMAGRRIQDYFAPVRETKFLDAVFSFSGKWKAVTRGRESYERYVRRTFEKEVFNPAEFEGVLAKIREDYAYGVQASENRLLVLLYEDIRPLRPGLSFEGFRLEYGRFARALAPRVLSDLAMNGVSLAGSEAAAVILVAALTSAGILGGSVATGATGGPWTFGVSLVVGLAAGLAVDWTVGEAYEDAARMEVHRHVNALRNQIVDDVTAALLRALLRYRKLQEECVRALYDGGSDGRVAARP